MPNFNLPPVIIGKINPLYLPHDHPDHPITKALTALGQLRQEFLRLETDDGDWDAGSIERMMLNLQDFYTNYLP